MARLKFTDLQTKVHRVFITRYTGGIERVSFIFSIHNWDEIAWYYLTEVSDALAKIAADELFGKVRSSTRIVAISTRLTDYRRANLLQKARAIDEFATIAPSEANVGMVFDKNRLTILMTTPVGNDLEGFHFNSIPAKGKVPDRVLHGTITLLRVENFSKGKLRDSSNNFRDM